MQKGANEAPFAFQAPTKTNFGGGFLAEAAGRFMRFCLTTLPRRAERS